MGMRKSRLILALGMALVALGAELGASFAEEKSEAFLVTLVDKGIKVVSPDKYFPEMSIIIENKTLTKILGKVERAGGEIITYVNIPSGETRSLDVSMKQGEEIFFVSLAPAFQETALVVGKKSYEIPPGK